MIQEVDGRLCAAASAQDEQTFAGCSTLASPDGDIGRPWCYLAPQLVDASSDSKNWSRGVGREFRLACRASGRGCPSVGGLAFVRWRQYCTGVVDYDAGPALMSCAAEDA